MPFAGIYRRQTLLAVELKQGGFLCDSEWLLSEAQSPLRDSQQLCASSVRSVCYSINYVKHISVTSVFVF